jgi:adenylate cyclase
MFKLISKILNCGIDQNTSVTDAKYIHIVNTLIFIFFFAMVFNIPMNIAYLPDSLSILLLVIINGLLSLSVFLFNAYKKYTLATIAAFTITSTHLCITELVVGTAHDLHYYLLVILFVLFFSLKKEQKFILWSLTAYISLCFFVSIYGSKLGLIPFPDSYNQAAKLSNSFLIFATCFAIASYMRNTYIKSENNLALIRNRSEELLLSILPESIAHRLRNSPGLIADRFESATVLFADLVNFKSQASHLNESESVDLLNDIFDKIDIITEKYALEKIKTIGNSYMLVGGVPEFHPDHQRSVGRAALDIRNMLIQKFPLISVRIGIDTGSLVAGVIGKHRFIYDLWGDCVNTASRMETHGIIGEIQVTDRFYQHTASYFNYTERGLVSIKGKGKMKLWLLS